MRRWVYGLCAVLAACASPAVAQQPQRGGTFVFGSNAEPSTYDCHAAASATVLVAVAPFYSTLVKFDSAAYPKIVGDLAESWTISDDQKVITFKLRPGVKFHDGSKLDSADVKASFDRVINPPDGIVSLRKAYFTSVDKVEAPNPLTVVFRLKNVDVSLMSSIASPYNCIYSAAALAADQRSPEKAIMGSGAFKFVSHTRGSDMVGQRFEGYFLQGRPYLDGFRVIFLGQSSAMLNSLQGGAILSDFRGLSPVERNRLVTALGDKVVVAQAAQISQLRLSYNSTKSPFNDIRVRRALNLAIDRWGGAVGLQKTTRMGPAGGLYLPGSEFATSEDKLAIYAGFRKDIEVARTEARALLKEAGQENLTFVLTNRNTSPYTEVGVFLIDQWRRIGVNVEHRPLDLAAWTAARSDGNYGAIVDFISADVTDPSFIISQYISIDRSPASPGRYTDRKLDELYDRQLTTSNMKDRLALLREFEDRVFNEQYSMPVLWVDRTIVHWANVRGWTITPSQVVGQDLVDVWLSQAK